MIFTPDQIDFNAYELETDAKRNVKPVSAWVDELIAKLRNPDQSPKVFLPWEKAHKLFTFRPGEVTVWMGQNGHGKTGIVNQVALSLIGQRQRVCVGSFEAKPTVTIDSMARMFAGQNLYDDAFQDGRGTDAIEEILGELKSFADGRLWLYDQQGTARPAHVQAMARYAAKVLGCTHIVIDNLAKCVPDEDDHNGQKRFVDELTAIARDHAVHIHLVHHIRKPKDENHVPDKHDSKGSGAITDQVDNVMIVWRNKAKEDDIKAKGALSNKRTEADAYLLCRKQRNGDDEPTIQLWFDRDSKQFKGDAADPLMCFHNFPHRWTA
jgi:twinkle protein